MNTGRKQLHSFLNFVSLNRPIIHRWVMFLYHIICIITGQSQCIRCGQSFLCLEKTCCWGSPLFGQLGLFVVPVQVWEYHMTVSLDMMELSLPCAQAMGTTQSKVCLDGASGKHSGYDHWTQCRPSWNHDEKQFLRAKCSWHAHLPNFPHFISFHIIFLIPSIQVIARPHLQSRLEASEVSWQVPREQWGIAIITRCSWWWLFSTMQERNLKILKFSCLGKEFIIDGLRFFSRDASLRRLYSHGGWERFDSCWPGTLWMAEVGDPCRGLLGYEITSIILNHLRLKRMRSWWLWMCCEWIPLQLHFRYRRVRLPSVRDASLTDGLANGANEMEGMLGVPEGRCQTEQGSLPSSQETAGNLMSWEANRERLNAFHYFKTFQYLFGYTVLGILARLTFGLHRLQVRPRRVPELRPVAPVRLVGLVGKCHFADMSSRWISDFLSPIWRTKSPCLKSSIPLWSLQ